MTIKQQELNMLYALLKRKEEKLAPGLLNLLPEKATSFGGVHS